MDFIMALLIYVLASAATMSVASVFGVNINFFEALSVWIVVSFLTHIVKNF